VTATNDPALPGPFETRLLDELIAFSATMRPSDPPRGTVAADRRRRRLRVLAPCLAVFLVTGTALATVGPWHPSLGNDRGGHPTTSATRLPTAATSTLAILRRQQSAADRGRDVTATLRIVGPQFHGVNVDDVRRLAPGDPARGNLAAILVTAQRLADDEDAGPHAAQAGELICMLYPTSQHLGANITCTPAHEIATGKASGNTGIGGPDPRVYGLVPDGVTSVRLQIEGGFTTTVPVHDNFYVAHADGAHQPLAGRTTATWLDSAGNIVRPLS
jgi:hypothetical protein